MREVSVTLADLSPGLDVRLRRDQVPEVPAGALRRQDDYGHRDVVFDYEDQRWRFRNGELIGYLVYAGKPRRPIAIWGGNY